MDCPLFSSMKGVPSIPSSQATFIILTFLLYFSGKTKLPSVLDDGDDKEYKTIFSI